MKTSEIKFVVTLDENKVPETIKWDATDSGIEGSRDCNAAMLAVWDGNENTTLRIDLWTKQMLVDDMKRFFYENMMTMAETYQRATNDPQMTREIKKFAEHFAKETSLFKTS